ncbi:hypothetical protein G5V59_11600 [Nocardioides sp. W3-2-3]|nr:hypothetical protein [Nocardioides convexus]
MPSEPPSALGRGGPDRPRWAGVRRLGAPGSSCRSAPTSAPDFISELVRGRPALCRRVPDLRPGRGDPARPGRGLRVGARTARHLGVGAAGPARRVRGLRDGGTAVGLLHLRRRPAAARHRLLVGQGDRAARGGELRGDRRLPGGAGDLHARAPPGRCRAAVAPGAAHRRRGGRRRRCGRRRAHRHPAPARRRRRTGPRAAAERLADRSVAGRGAVLVAADRQPRSGQPGHQARPARPDGRCRTGPPRARGAGSPSRAGAASGRRSG